jgi:hypothetical protein
MSSESGDLFDTQASNVSAFEALLFYKGKSFTDNNPTYGLAPTK